MAISAGRIFIFTRRTAWVERLRKAISDSGHEIIHHTRSKEAILTLVSERFDLFIIDSRIADKDRTTLLKTAAQADPGLTQILIFGQPEVDDVLSIVRSALESKTRAEPEVQSVHRDAQSYHDLMDSIPVLVFKLDARGRFTDINRNVSQVFGLPESEIIGKSVTELNVPVEAARVWEALQHRVIVKGETLEDEISLQLPDGAWRVFGVRLSPIFDPDGKVAGTIGMSHDITGRKQNENIIQRQLEQFRALHTIDLAILSSTDLRITLDTIIAEIIRQLGVDAAAIFLYKPDRPLFEFASGRGFRHTAISRARARFGEGLAGRVAIERRLISRETSPASQADFEQSVYLRGESFVQYWALPLISKGQLKGVLEVFSRTPIETGEEWISFLEALASQAAISIDNSQLFSDLQRSNLELALAYDETIEGWASALDLHDREFEGHTRRVTDICLHLARLMNISEENIVHIRRGALLHDIGKLGIPDSILLKPGPLTDEEWEVVKRHPIYAYELLSPISFLRPALNIPYHHHENWDGSGYPLGLKGERIPFEARMFAVVNTWDVLRSNRPYREAWTDESAIRYIQEQSGQRFDPLITEIFLSMLESPELNSQ